MALQLHRVISAPFKQRAQLDLPMEAHA